MKADIHVHSNYSLDVPNLPEFSPRALYERAREQGLGFFTLTDHDTMQGVEELRRELKAAYGDQLPIPVVPGVELKVFDPAVGHTIHINVLGLSRSQMRRLMKRRNSVERFTAYCREQNLFHVYNHPLWFERGERASLKTVDRLIRRFPVIELNAGRIRELNVRTAALARLHGKPMVAASDTHIGHVGKSYTEVEADTPTAFFAGVLEGRGRPVPSHFGLPEFFHELSETVDLWLRRMPSPVPKRSVPQGIKDRYWLANRILGRRLLTRAFLPRALGATLKFAARATAYFFIRQQRRMLLRLGESVS